MANRTGDQADSGVSTTGDGRVDSADDDMGTSADDDSATSADDDSASQPDGLIGADDDTAGGGSGLDAGVSGGGLLVDASVPTVPSGLGGGFVSVGQTDAGVLQVLCGNDPCACSDGIDNDGDGLADGADSECTGPFDNDESTFATGIPGDNRDPKWQDCFFDGNSGAGDDGCRYHTDCLTGDADPSSPECTLTDECRQYCAPLTPPGCDCFGCCEIPLPDGGSVNVLVSDQCSLANIDDEQACQRCTPTDACNNECGECEICIGETLADLPDSCFGTPPDGSGGSDGSGGNNGSGGNSSNGGSTSGGGRDGSGGSSNAGGPSSSGGMSDPGTPDQPPPNVCDGGATACIDISDCGSGQYCSLGCCKTFPAR